MSRDYYRSPFDGASCRITQPINILYHDYENLSRQNFYSDFAYIVALLEQEWRGNLTKFTLTCQIMGKMETASSAGFSRPFFQ